MRDDAQCYYCPTVSVKLSVLLAVINQGKAYCEAYGPARLISLAIRRRFPSGNETPVPGQMKKVFAQAGAGWAICHVGAEATGIIENLIHYPVVMKIGL